MAQTCFKGLSIKKELRKHFCLRNEEREMEEKFERSNVEHVRLYFSLQVNTVIEG